MHFVNNSQRNCGEKTQEGQNARGDGSDASCCGVHHGKDDYGLVRVDRLLSWSRFRGFQGHVGQEGCSCSGRPGWHMRNICRCWLASIRKHHCQQRRRCIIHMHNFAKLINFSTQDYCHAKILREKLTSSHVDRPLRRAVWRLSVDALSASAQRSRPNCEFSSTSIM